MFCLFPIVSGHGFSRFASAPDEECNEMEELMLAAMKHLPTAVIYVMDLSGQVGDKCLSIEYQLQLHREVQA